MSRPKRATAKKSATTIAKKLMKFHDRLHETGTIHYVERRLEGYYLLWPHDDTPLPIKAGDNVRFQGMLLPPWFEVPEMAIGERVQG